MIKNFIETIEKMNPEDVFHPNFRKNNPELGKYFNDFFEKNYHEIQVLGEVNFSTNHVYFHFFQNTQNNDIQILRVENGCFHSKQDFVIIEQIEQHRNNLIKEKDTFLLKNPNDNKNTEEKFFNPKINSIQKVIDTYYQLTKKQNKPKI